MEHSVDDVIGKLSEIEATSVRILEAADAKKKGLSETMEKKIKEFDQKLAEETESKLEQLKVQLDKEKEQEMLGLRTETDRLLQKMQDAYDRNHSRWSGEIVKTIVKV